MRFIADLHIHSHFSRATSREMDIPALARVGKLDRSECRRWVEQRFSADRMVEDYLKVYKKILTEHRRLGRNLSPTEV